MSYLVGNKITSLDKKYRTHEFSHLRKPSTTKKDEYGGFLKKIKKFGCFKDRNIKDKEGERKKEREMGNP